MMQASLLGGGGHCAAISDQQALCSTHSKCLSVPTLSSPMLLGLKEPSDLRTSISMVKCLVAAQSMQPAHVSWGQNLEYEVWSNSCRRWWELGLGSAPA